MPRRLSAFIIALVVLVSAAACADRAASDVAPTDAWLGQWTGPEGTLLLIEGGQGIYQVTVRNLDGPLTFEGRTVEAGIEFMRGGNTEVIHATDGAGTGMKWLVDKKNCLMIRSGEGFCRD